MKTRNETKKWISPVIVFIVFLVFILVLFLKYCWLSLATNLYGINMDEFSSNRNTYETTLYAKRGTIYDSTGNTLALDISSYTVIAYLDESRTGSSKTLYHVKDVKGTAEALAPILNMSVESLVSLMSKDVYQVELGPGGRGITELTKAKIEELNLPGISFIESYKRYYPNGDFASYIIGYAKKNETKDNEGKTINEIVGELGIESQFDKSLKGVNGYLSYQRDKYGYKIPDTPEINNKAEDGTDIYLTLDANIQRIVEASVNDAEEKYEPEWITLNVMDAKTGDILASSSSPSFDPNLLNIKNYENPLTSFVYEPGSVMKIFTYMCTMEKGKYVGTDTYPSGNIVIGSNTIYDWNRYGWGTISFDMGFQLSSNVGVSYLVQDYINREDLKECLTKYGFGTPTGINLPRELNGTISFSYAVEVAAAAYGQGISTTPIQILRALSLISNNGKMLQPNIISKIVDSKGNITMERSITETEQLISKETVDYLKNLMYNTVNGERENVTGYGYKVEGLDVIGKTGTAEVYDSSTGRYSSEWNNKIYSFAGMFPKDDPKIVVFISIKKPNNGSSSAVYNTAQPVMESIGKYLGLISNDANKGTVNKYNVESYTSKKVVEVEKDLKEKGLNVVVLGDGEYVINQYPKNGEIITDDKVFLITNGSITMPDIIGYSRIDVITLFNLLNLPYELEGYGVVTKQSIEKGKTIDDTVYITLEKKYDFDKKETEEKKTETEEE